MLSYSKQEFSYGNLQNYKYYVKPQSELSFGKSSQKHKDKHSKAVLRLLKQLSLQGPSTTWQLAKIPLPNELDNLRKKDKEFRRLIVGRESRGKHYPGLLELGLVVTDGFNLERAPARKYRLSLHGILYVFNIFDYSELEIDEIAKNYSKVLPKIFGKWEFLKKNESKSFNKLKGLSKGILLDNYSVKDNPVNDLMTYLQIKYRSKYEFIEEEDFAEQISFWFYTTFLIPSPNKQKAMPKLKNILKKDLDLLNWYMHFYNETKLFYQNKLNSINEFIM